MAFCIEQNLFYKFGSCAEAGIVLNLYTNFEQKLFKVFIFINVIVLELLSKTLFGCSELINIIHYYLKSMPANLHNYSF